MAKELKIYKALKYIWDEFVYGGHFFSLSAAAVVGCVIILNSRYEDILPLLLVAYLLPQIIFNYDHLKDCKKDWLTNPERSSRLSERYGFYSLLFYVYILLFFINLFFLPINLITFLVVIVLFGIFYPKGLTKKIVGFKNFYSAFFFASIVFFPFLYFSLKIDLSAILFFSFAFLRGLVNTTFFDVKDEESDRLEGLKTLPVVFGKKVTIKYLKFVNILSFIPLIIGLCLAYFPTFFASLLLFFFYSLIYLKKGDDFSNLRSLSYVMVDGEYYLWLLVVIISKLIIVG